MTSPAELDPGLRAALAPGLHGLVPDLAQLLGDVETGQLTEQQARARLTEPANVQLMRMLLEAGWAPPVTVGSIVNSTGVAVGPNARVTFEGPGYPLPDYRSEVDNRLAYYRETFIGREALLAELMQPPAPTPYTVVTAPAGFGKSALAARLVDHWEAGTWPGPRPRLVYFFARQENAEHTPVFFLQRVNAQLVTLLGYSGGVPGDLELLRSQFSHLWSRALEPASPGQPLVLLVDGLDEMAPGDVTIASLLPDRVPGARVIVTSRPNPDPRTLVRSMHPLRRAAVKTLAAFTLAEVEQLLTRSGLEPARAGAVAPQVLELTKGEPLYARFLALEIGPAGEIPPRLLAEPPADVREYFDYELDALWKTAGGELAREVLGMLVAARAGLTAGELASLLDRQPYELAPVLQAIQRYLIGADRRELMHRELRRAVAGKYSSEQLEAYGQQLLAWCASFAQAGWPAATPVYVLQHYAPHL
jgi:hypothetical protein